jgi:hypothetical protein
LSLANKSLFSSKVSPKTGEIVGNLEQTQSANTITLSLVRYLQFTDCKQSGKVGPAKGEPITTQPLALCTAMRPSFEWELYKLSNTKLPVFLC